MKMRTPPKLATWLLEHFYRGANRDSLVGDLLEEYQQGRTHVWYWNQILSAIALSNVQFFRFKLWIALLYVGYFCCEIVVGVTVVSSIGDWGRISSLKGWQIPEAITISFVLPVVAAWIAFKILRRIRQLRQKPALRLF